MGKKLGAISFVQILAPELNDRMLADFLDMESSVLVNLHVQSVDQVNAIKTVKRKITDLDKSKIEEQKKAVRAGYDMDIIPSDLATYGAEAKKLLQDLQSRNERMFLLTFLILNTADTPRQLDNNIFQTSSIAQKYNCALTRLDFQQEEGLMSSLPLGLNQIEIQRGLTTSSVAIFVPFTTQELFQNGSEALYYGINALSNNLIMVDRKLLKNPNGLILGTPGSGKSFSAKREITNAFLICPKDDIIICDPEGEYTPLVERLHGQVIKLSPTGKGYDGSPCYINPMDLNLDYSDDDNPLSLKSDFILSLCELIVGGKDGLAPVEKTIIDRCVRIVYRDYLNDPKPENMPLLPHRSRPEKPRRPSISPRIRCWLRWKTRARRICQMMPSARASEPRRPAPVSLKSWCPPVLWSAGSPKRSQICCPRPPARRLSPFCLNSSSLRSSPLNGSTA